MATGVGLAQISLAQLNSPTPKTGFINSRPIGGHLGRHLGFDSFPVLYFGRFLVCYSPPQTLPETVKKTSASNFLGVQPYFYSTTKAYLSQPTH